MEKYFNKGGNKMEDMNMNYNMEPENGPKNELPSEVSIWTKIKNYLFQDIVVDLTPKQAKVFQEVHDFWHQELTPATVKDFLFQEIEIK